VRSRSSASPLDASDGSEEDEEDEAATQRAASRIGSQLSAFNSDRHDNKSVYSELTEIAYAGDDFLGAFELPVLLMSPAEVAAYLCTRGLDEEHVVELMESLLSHPAGLKMRDNLKAVLIKNPADNKNTEGAFQQMLSKLKKAGRRERREMIISLLKKKAILAITIAGNHTRESCTRHIRAGKFEKDMVLRVDVFAGISAQTARAIGFIDNLVADQTKSYSLLDKVSMIRDIVLDQDNYQSGSLTFDALRICVFDIMYKDLRSSVGKKAKRKSVKAETPESLIKKRIEQAHPFLRACRVPNELWPTVSRSLMLKGLNITNFRTINWSHDPAQLKKAFETFNQSGDYPQLQKAFTLIRARSKLISSLHQIFSDLPAARKIARNQEEFVAKLKNLQDLDILTGTFLQPLLSTRHNQVFKSPELTNSVTLLISRILAKERSEAEDVEDAIQCSNRAGKTSSHKFIRSDCINALPLLKSEDADIGFVVLDPPFGLLDELWDAEWPENYWAELFRDMHMTYPKTAILCFLAEGQLEVVRNAASLQGWNKSRIYSWLKTDHTANFNGRISYPVNLILLLWNGRLSWQSEDASHIMNGNFVATPKTNVWKVAAEVLNSTQKPIVLMRAFLSCFCPRSSAVLDLCSGSGSTAIAAASLGIDSFSVDLREGQVEGAKLRMKSEAAKPGWYPPPNTVFKWEALRRSITAACLEPEKEPFVEKRMRSKSLPVLAAAAAEAEELSGEEDEDVIALADQDLIAVDSEDEAVEAAEERSAIVLQSEDDEEDEEMPTAEDIAFIDDQEITQPTQHLAGSDSEGEELQGSDGSDAMEAEEEPAPEVAEATAPNLEDVPPEPATGKRPRRIHQRFNSPRNPAAKKRRTGR
jgi:hypothetical protein